MYINVNELIQGLEKEFITQEEAKFIFREYLASQVNVSPKVDYAQCLAPGLGSAYHSNQIFKA